jgi:hypothetical protein
MANTANPFGFRQFGQREGTAPTGGMDRLFITSSDTNLYFTGDVVALSSYSLVAGTLSPVSSLLTVGLVAPVGVFQGCEYYNSNVSRTVWSSYWPGNQGSSAFYNGYVCTNTQQLYIAQCTSGAVVGTSCIGLNISGSVTGSSLGNQVTGQSVQTLLSTTVTGLSSTGGWRIVDTYQNYAPPGVNGTSSGAEGLQILVVQPNNFARNALTAVST